MAMMKATRRTEFGSRQVRRLRDKGDIPGVLYGHGKENTPIAISEHDMELAVLHGERLLEVDIEGKREHALIKEIQWDTFGHVVLHVDLTRVNLDERVEVAVPVSLHGTPAGIEEGGTLQQYTAEVTIECLVTAIPDDISIRVGEMNIGDTLHAGDMELPEGAKLLDDPETAICSVTYVAEELPAEEEEAAEEVAAEPEVIGETAEEGEGEAAEAEE